MKEDDLEFEQEIEHTIEDSKQLISKLRDRLKKSESEKQEYLLGWQKAKADYINTRKKDEESNKEFAKYAETKLVAELIPVLDSFDLAFAHKDTWKELPDEWKKGIENIHSKLWDVLKKHHLKAIDPNGEIFDPNTSEAIGIIETDKPEEEDMVLDVFQKGYMIHDKLIRSAKVRVGKLKG